MDGCCVKRRLHSGQEYLSMGDRRASSSASWLSEGSQRGQGQCLVDFWCWIREGIVVVVGCDINVVVVTARYSLYDHHA